MKSQPAEHTSRKDESSSQLSTRPPVKKPPAIPTQIVNPTPTVVQPEPPQTAKADSTALPSTYATDEPNPEQIMMEVLQKFGHGVKASEFFARITAVCKQEEATSTLTPLQIPPRPSTLQETPTSQTLISHTENPQISPKTLSQKNPQIPAETLAPPSPHAEAAENPQEEKAEEARVVEEGSSGEGVVRQDAMGTEEDVVKTGEGEGDDKDDAEIPGEGREPEKASEAEITGAGDGNPEEVVEGEIPSVVEGETPMEVIADQNVEKVVSERDKVATESNDEAGKVEEKMVTTPGIEEDTGVRNEEKKIEAKIVMIDDVLSDDEGTPTDERATRRKSRRDRRLFDTPPESQQKESRLEDPEEIEKGVSQTEGTPREIAEESSQAQENLEEAEVSSPKAEQDHLAKERKRKGKQEAAPLKRKQRQASSTLKIRETSPDPIRVPFEEVDEEDMEIYQENEPAYDLMEVLLTKRLLEAMAHFDDPKLAEICTGRASKEKLAKAGKMYDPSSLQEIESEAEFVQYIRAIGFEWLLDHSTAEVPIALAKEFFTSFKFKSTMDPDADSISFRLFDEHMVMSIREWSLRMGLFTKAEDDEGVWNEREIGPPKKTPGFDMQEAWKLITNKRGGKFKTSMSKGYHIVEPLLRFAQVFLGYNLLGQTSAALTTPELYFTWCMVKGVKVHLGYWLAYACNSMTSHPDCHLYTCHLLGAYLQRNVCMKVGKSVASQPVCDAPELFNVAFLFNKGLLYMDKGELVFYEVGKPDVVKTEKEEGEASAKVTDGEWRAKMEELMLKLGDNAVAQRGLMEVQTEKLTQAVDVMMKMIALVEKQILLAQQRLSSKAPAVPDQPAPGVSPVKSVSNIPASTPAKKRKDTTTTISVPVKRETPKPAGQKASQEDEPVPPPKKTKMTARKSGPPGDQTQK